MEGTEFLGVSFRSTGHLAWFMISMGILGVILYEYRFRLKKQTGKLNFSAFIVYYPIISHAATCILAIFVTRFGKVNGPVYSVDCIWFNAVMVGLYLVIWRVVNQTIVKRGENDKKKVFVAGSSRVRN